LARFSSLKSVASSMVASSSSVAGAKIAKSSVTVSKAKVTPLIQSRWFAQGAVKWFNTEKGYGFLTPDDGGADIFVHVSSINGTGFKVLNEGDVISYDVEERAKGTVAVNVNLVQPNPNPPRRRAPRPHYDE